jgi:AraC family transcriptional regulator of adaptative response/methylated-DNA-[protein]-cysteine methyltransferase
METILVDSYARQAEDYRRIEQAIRYLDANRERQPDLNEVAESVHLSPYHFQRLFTRWVGVSPKRFTQYLTKEHARELLDRSQDVLTTAYDSSLSSPGRLHDLFITWEAVTPGEYRRHGAGLEIMFGFHPTPFGECLLALSPRGVTSLVFLQDGNRQAAQIELQQRWSNARLVHDQVRTAPMIAPIFSFFKGRSTGRIDLHVLGTGFQLKVWEALLRVPSGSVVSYEDIAVQIGLPGAARAVGNAIGQNPLPVIIPCHRVIRQTGEIGGYRWGPARKKALLGWEMAWSENAQATSTVLA